MRPKKIILLFFLFFKFFYFIVFLSTTNNQLAYLRLEWNKEASEFSVKTDFILMYLLMSCYVKQIKNQNQNQKKGTWAYGEDNAKWIGLRVICLLFGLGESLHSFHSFLK